MHSLLIAWTLFGAATCFMNFPIEISKCKKGQWHVRNFIVFNCHSDDTHKGLKPFACDPTNGKLVKKRKRPVFLHETYEGKGFIYGCDRDNHTNGVVWKAVACYINGEKFAPGTFVKGRYDSVYLCYKDLDGIIRLRMRKPFHDHCNAGKGDPNCQQGILQGIWNSDFSLATAIKYDIDTNEPVDLDPPRKSSDQNITTIPVFEFPKLKAEDLLRSIQGQVNPAFVTEPPQVTHQLGDSLSEK
ncbi:hypothetical protein COOONC_07192 [Cooperia oncophora]